MTSFQISTISWTEYFSISILHKDTFINETKIFSIFSIITAIEITLLIASLVLHVISVVVINKNRLIRTYN